MAGLTDLLPLLTASMTGLQIGGTPVVTVLDHIPERPLVEEELPAILVEVLAPSVAPGHSNTRRLRWPLDIWLLATSRTGDIGTSIPAIFDLGDDVIARIDAQRTFNGLTAKQTEYADPAMSIDDDQAYGVTAPIGDTVLVGTTVHAIFTLDRVGGF